MCPAAGSARCGRGRGWLRLHVTDDWRRGGRAPRREPGSGADARRACTSSRYLPRPRRASTSSVKSRSGRMSKKPTRMWSAVRDAGVAHYVPFWTRYVPSFIRARETGRRRRDVGRNPWRHSIAGTIRVPRRSRTRGGTMPSLSSAGSIADVGSHAYDAVCWITGLRGPPGTGTRRRDLTLPSPTSASD